MVSQKRYGFNGFQPPPMPRASRSTRRRAEFQRRAEDDQMRPFDLLAAIADKLLQEKESPTLSSDTSLERDQLGFVKEGRDAHKLSKSELSNDGSCDKKRFSLCSQTNNQNFCSKEFPHLEFDAHSRIASTVSSPSCLERLAAGNLVGGKSHNKMESVSGEVKLDSSCYPMDSHFRLSGDSRNGKDVLHKFENAPIGNGTEMCSFKDALDENPPALISLDSNAKFSVYNDGIHFSSLSKGCDNEPVVSKDDDENSSGCTHPSSTKTKSFRPKTYIGDNRISKTLVSIFQKVAEKSKVDTHSNGDLKRTYHSKKHYNKRQHSQMNIPFKKRKLFNCNSFSSSNGFTRSSGTYCPTENCLNQDVYGSPLGMHKDPRISSLEGSQHQVLCHRGSHVKLRIKSFRVPELFFEVPETATIGSLKRTVMEAVTAVLGSELQIGVILQGKKVWDDSKTLLQTGISHGNQLDALRFTLEPDSSRSLPIVCAASSPHPKADIAHPIVRYPSCPPLIHKRKQDNADMLPEHQVTNLGSIVESDHDSAPSPINASVDESMTDSKELVTVPEVDKKELAMIPVLQKPKRTEIMQRRIRRPFSVDEVEALVQAVEKLGTGRWRDVKLCAFDNSEHRTYVDLKDKWKTLVHTARISPQQRRGEPVPQELLDRVLVAHAYWSQQQNKQHLLSKDQGLLGTSGLVDGVDVLVSDFCY